MSVVEYILISRQWETEEENEAAFSKHHNIEFWQDGWVEARHNVQVQKQLEEYFWLILMMSNELTVPGQGWL